MLSITEAHTKSLRDMENSRTLTEPRSFLGMCNVYRQFVPSHSRIAVPLNKLLKMGQPTNLQPLNDDQSLAFKTLVVAILSPAILSLSRLGLIYTVETDACDHQIGPAPFHTQLNEERKPLGLWSRTLPFAKKNYFVPENKFLAVVCDLPTLGPYLQECENITVLSDQA